jgi:endonuclease/exonuclease/phosphatase family metal-dependent hydrolase
MSCAGQAGDKSIRVAHHGPAGTFTGFPAAYSPDGKAIDFIFIKNKVRVSFHGTLSDTFDGKRPSDHLPLLAEVMVD